MVDKLEKLLCGPNGSAAMLAAKRSAGIASEVYLRNPLHTGDEACKHGIHTGFETEARRHQKSNTGISVVLQKGLMSFKTFINEENLQKLFVINTRNISNNAWFVDNEIAVSDRKSIVLTFSRITNNIAHWNNDKKN